MSEPIVVEGLELEALRLEQIVMIEASGHRRPLAGVLVPPGWSLARALREIHPRARLAFDPRPWAVFAPTPARAAAWASEHKLPTGRYHAPRRPGQGRGLAGTQVALIDPNRWPPAVREAYLEWCEDNL